VARRPDNSEGKPYELVCGQGRLEAYISLGQTEVPAIITDASTEECFLMSLVENIARKNQPPVELLRAIGSLKTRGYSNKEISQKIDVTPSYVNGIIHLLENGEDRLLAAVEKGKIPVSVAMAISSSDEAGIQKLLCDAYENKSLRGRKLQTVRRVIRERHIHGKKFRIGMRRKDPGLSSAESLVKVYRREADRQKLLVKKARLTETRLLFMVSAIRKLFLDEDFVTLLRAEGLDTLPSYLAERMPAAEKR
jgi:ParB family chromosome partitioning protein